MISSSEIVPVDDTAAPRWVYIVSPLRIFHSPRYLRMLAQMRNHFPTAAFIIGRDASTSSNGRPPKWPSSVRQSACVCVFPDHEGWISRGVWDEMWDTVAQDVMVVVTDGDSLVRPVDEIMVAEINPRNQWHFARLAFRNWASRIDGA